MGKKGKKVRPQYVAKANRKKERMSKKAIIGWIAGVGLLLLCIILFFVLYDDGSLPVRDGVIADKQDNWIISKLQTASSEKYFKLGEVVGSLEEYEVEAADSIKSDTNETAFSYVPVDPDSQIDGYYITGVASSADDMVTNLPLQFALYFPDSQFSEPGTIEIAGAHARYLTAVIPETLTEETLPEETEGEATKEATEEAAPEDTTTPEEIAAPEEATAEEDPDAYSDGRTATQQVLCYIPAVRNSCILISVNLRIDDEMQEWTEEALLELIGRIGETIVLAK